MVPQANPENVYDIKYYSEYLTFKNLQHAAHAFSATLVVAAQPACTPFYV